MWTLLTTCRYQTGLVFNTRAEARAEARKSGHGLQVARLGEGWSPLSEVYRAAAEALTRWLGP